MVIHFNAQVSYVEYVIFGRRRRGLKGETG